jgi:hypothetical protein
MQPSLIHLEHGLPALAELGIEHVIPLLGGGVLDASTLGAALQGLAGGAQKRAARVLVAVSKATGKELLAWEADPTAQVQAEKEAALLPFDEAKQAVMDFFASLGPSPFVIRDSSEIGKETPAPPEPAPAPAP